MATGSRRLSILTNQEIDDIYGLPRFTENDRHFFFDKLIQRVEVQMAKN